MEIGALITGLRNAENYALRGRQFYSDLAEALNGLNLSVKELSKQYLRLAGQSSGGASSNTGSSESSDLSILDVTYAAAITPSWQANNQIIRVQCTGNLSVAFPTNMSNGRRLRFLFEADGTPRQVTLNSSWYNMPAALTPIALAANTNCYIEFVQLDLTNGRCTSIVQGHQN